MVFAIHIILQNDSGEILELDLDSQTTVFEVKCQIARLWYIPCSRQQVSLDGSDLSEDLPLAACCDGDCETLRLHVAETCEVMAKRVLTEDAARDTLHEWGFAVMRTVKNTHRSIAFHVRETLCANAETFVAKATSLIDVDEADRVNLRKEIGVLHRLAVHPNIVEYREIFPDDTGDILFSVTPYADGGNLLGVIAESRKMCRAVAEPVALTWIGQMLAGLQHLHCRGVVACDLNPSNLFLCDGLRRIRIGGIGVARIHSMCRTFDGAAADHSSPYMSPELLRNEEYAPHTDMWALGCVCFQLCTLSVPFEAGSLLDLALRIVEGEPVWGAWRDFSEALQTVARRLLAKEAMDRPSAADLLKEALFSNDVRSADDVLEEAWASLTEGATSRERPNATRCAPTPDRYADLELPFSGYDETFESMAGSTAIAMCRPITA